MNLRLAVLGTLAAGLAATALVVLWPEGGKREWVGLAPQELRALGGDRLARDRLLAHLLYRVGGVGGCRSWRRLPDDERALWVTVVFEGQLLIGMDEYLRRRQEVFEDPPSLTQVADGYRRLGCDGQAALVESLEVADPGDAKGLAALERSLAAGAATVATARRRFIDERAEALAGP